MENRCGKVKGAVTPPDKEEGYLRGFAAPYFDDCDLGGNWGGWGFHVGAQQSPEDYYWARTHVFLPKDAENHRSFEEIQAFLFVQQRAHGLLAMETHRPWHSGESHGD